jgi:hypothetical protein
MFNLLNQVIAKGVEMRREFVSVSINPLKLHSYSNANVRLCEQFPTYMNDLQKRSIDVRFSSHGNSSPYVSFKPLESRITIFGP